MKKIMIICLTFALTLTMLTACTQNQSGSQQDGQTAQEETDPAAGPAGDCAGGQGRLRRQLSAVDADG